MFRVLLALIVAGASAGASVLKLASTSVPSPKPTTVKGCPNGGVGIGEALLCPLGGSFNKDGECIIGHDPSTNSDIGTSGTAVIYKRGSCDILAQRFEIGNAGYCTENPNVSGYNFEPYNQGALVYCGTAGSDAFYISVPGYGNFTKCTFYDGEGLECPASSNSNIGYRSIGACCT